MGEHAVTDYISSEGANAAAGEVVDYSGNVFSYAIDGQFDAYYITRVATAWDYGWANLTGNSVTLYDSEGSDEVNVNVDVGASYGGIATSSSNNWVMDLGDGDDGGGVHISAYANGADAVASIYSDSYLTVRALQAALEPTHFSSLSISPPLKVNWLAWLTRAARSRAAPATIASMPA